MNLFVLDSGISDKQTQDQTSGQIVELTLEPQALPVGTTLLPSTLVALFQPLIPYGILPAQIHLGSITGL